MAVQARASTMSSSPFPTLIVGEIWTISAKPASFLESCRWCRSTKSLKLLLVANDGLAPRRCMSSTSSQGFSHRVAGSRLLIFSGGHPRIVSARAGAPKVEADKFDYKMYEALLRGGEEVTAIFKEILELLEDIAGFDKEEEEVAVRMAAASVVGQKLNQLQGNFLMALDWTIEQTEKQKDDQKKKILEIIKETVLAQLQEESPSQVRVLGALCTTSCKDARQEILRRCAGGGGLFKTEKGNEINLPGANLNDVANQADDILSTMEAQPLVPDRRLLAKLVLIREEARSLLGGGMMDERNDNKGLKNLPEPEVNFLSKMVAQRPSPYVRQKLENVMRGKDEGQEKESSANDSQPARRRRLINIEPDVSSKVKGKDEGQNRPVRPGIFLETLTKLLAGMYATKSAAGVTVQHLEWLPPKSCKKKCKKKAIHKTRGPIGVFVNNMHRVTMDILQDIAFS